MRFTQRNTSVLFLFFFVLNRVAHASLPVWSFIPSSLYPPSTIVTPYDSATVVYTVINNSSSPHSLYMVPMQGISSSVTGCSSSSSCLPGAELCLPGKNSTCTLTLSITGGQLNGNVTKGPELCQYGQTKDGPSKQQCYTPASPLNITVIIPPSTTLSVSQRAIIPVNGSSASLTVMNTGTETAYAVSADLSSLTCTTSPRDIHQDASNCAKIFAGDSCQLNFTSSTPCLAETASIIGGNISNSPTAALAFSIQDYLVFALSSPVSTMPQVVYTSVTGTHRWADALFSPPTTSLTDGYTNTVGIVNASGGGQTAANDCSQTTTTAPVVWYLPAICQMGGTPQNRGTPCENNNTNTIDNLVQLGFITFSFGNHEYWSSSVYDTTSNPPRAWAQQWQQLNPLSNPPTSAQATLNWTTNRNLFCAGSITY